MDPPRGSGPSRKGFARIIRGRGRGGSALILGQRPTSPKGAQCYVGPLAHCGSHCCANCITTGSGRDLPSVARNSVSRGLVPGAAQCNSNGTTSYTRRQTSPARSTAAVTFIALRGRCMSHRCREVVRPRPCYVRPFEACALPHTRRREEINRAGGDCHAKYNASATVCFSLSSRVTISAIQIEPFSHRLTRFIFFPFLFFFKRDLSQALNF